MIAHLSGKLLFKSPTLSVIDCQGVGYEVMHSPFCAEKLESEKANLFIHTHVREDALQLFGFSNAEERILFRELLKVNGVGPKMALSIMSGMPYTELVLAIRSKDKTRLQKIPGIGKKIAERLAIELGDRFAEMPSLGLEAGTGIGPMPKDSELESVLLNLGYQRSEIQRVQKNIRTREEKYDDLSLEVLVRLSLRELTQGRPV